MKKTILAGSALLAGYVGVCVVEQMAGLRHMNRQNSVAVNAQYGADRLAQLRGRNITTEYSIYSPEETAQEPTRQSVTLYHFPSDEKKTGRYVLICPGGAYREVALDVEGFPAAARFNEYGYTAFVLKYRTGAEGGDYHAVHDLARALRYIKANAEVFGVEADDYVTVGFSAGGNLVGLFGTEGLGYPNYEGIAKPSAILMCYPWCNPNTRTPSIARANMYMILNHMGRRGLLGERATREQKQSMRVPQSITPEYPPVYVIHGSRDIAVPASTNTEVLVKALEANGIPFEYEKAEGANHGFGLGEGTSAEGWIGQAVAFMEKRK